MKIQECIDRLDGQKPNQYSLDDKVRWLAELDAAITNDWVKTHELLPEEKETVFIPYTVNDLGKNLIAPFPYDELYVTYLEMRIDEKNKETARYNNSATMFNARYNEFTSYYHNTHKPIKISKYRIW